MKKSKAFRHLAALAASAMMLAFLPNTNALTVSAAEPVTYYVMYEEDGNGDGDWYFQLGSEWNDEAESRSSYYMHTEIKDGDIVIVGNAAPHSLDFNVHLSNLTIKNTSGALAMVSASGGIDNCYFLNGTQGSVTGNVFNAYVYGGSIANFNNNVTNLYSYDNDPDANPTIGVSGTVAYFMAEDSQNSNAPYGINFAANSFHVEDGDLKTDPSQYTRDVGSGPISSTTSAPKPTPKPAAPAASDEYDAVPKTGETSPVLWLSLSAAFCLCAGLSFRKSTRQ